MATGIGTKIDWSTLDNANREIEGFLRSVNPTRFGTGLAFYDEAHFVLEPRNNYVSNRRLQRVLTYRNDEAKFEATEKAFAKLKEKVQAIKERIDLFDPKSKEECTSETKTYLLNLIRIQHVVAHISKKGLQTFCDNYKDDKKPESAATLQRLGEESFTLIDQLEKGLEEKFLRWDSESAPSIREAKLEIEGIEFLKKFDVYRTHLQMVTASPEAHLPKELIEGAIADRMNLSKPTRTTLFSSCRVLGLSKMAQDVGDWTPMRLTTKAEGVVQEDGLTGICEMEGGSLDNLSDLWYRADDGRVVISCGNVNSDRKENQLTFAIGEALTLTPTPSELFVVHQLDSVSRERDLIEGIKKRLPNIKQCLQSKFPEKQITLLHVNTPVTEMGKNGEESHASLVQLTDLVLKEVKGLVSEMETTKGRIGVHAALIESFFRKSQSIAPPLKLKENVLPQIDKICEALFDAKLNHGTWQATKAYILSKTLQALYNGLTSQVDTRVQTLELYLFLYKLLKINPILVGADSLDRGGFARSIVSSLNQLERECREEAAKRIITEDPQTKEMKVAVEAQEQVFLMLLNIAKFRTELFKGLEVLIKEKRWNLISNLKFWDKKDEKPLDIRESLFAEIAIKFRSGSECQRIQLAHRYFEIIAGELFGKESEKLLFSTGVIGFVDERSMSSYVPEWMYTNSFLTQRLPLYIKTDGATIRLLQFTEGGSVFSDSEQLTPAGDILLHRAGSTRKQ